MNTSRSFLLGAIACAALAGLSSLNAADWAQWRGPQRTGISTETGLLQTWPKEGPKLVWQVSDAGGGYSTPAVAGNRLFLLSSEGADKESVQARNTSDGKLVWSTAIGKVGPNQGPQYPGSRSTPTVDGESVYALGSDGDLVCLEAATGKIRWQKSLRADFGGVPGKWAYAESPLVDGDTLVVCPGGAQATVVALKKTTGEVVWKAALPEADAASYASAQILEQGGRRQYVQFLEKGLVGLDAKTGRQLWRYTKTAQGSPANIPTPVLAQGMIYSGAGRTGGGLVKLKGEGDSQEAEQVYFNVKLPTAIGGAVKIGDYLYGASGNSWLCVDFAKGDLKWEDRSIGAGSVMAADGRLYLHGENGDLALVEPTPDGYREHGRFTPSSQPDRNAIRAKAWAYPVVAGGRLYVRDLNVVWCYDVAASR